MMHLDPSIPMPARVAKLRRHKGLPVPSMVLDDAHGVPNFRVIDIEKWEQLAHARGCGICGARLGSRLWFVGGPKSIESRFFTDLPMHKDCAEFALRVCPFLAMPRFRFIDAHVELPDGLVVHVNEHVSTQRPDKFGLASSNGYAKVRAEVGVLRANVWTAIEWWQQGKRTG